MLCNVPKVGLDHDTQIRLDLIEPNWILIREDFEQGGYIRLKLNNAYDYTLDIQQGEFFLYDYRLGAEGTNSITIIQTNN